MSQVEIKVEKIGRGVDAIAESGVLVLQRWAARLIPLSLS